MIRKSTNKIIKKTTKNTKKVKNATKKTNKKMGVKKPAKKVTKKLAIKKAKTASKKMTKKVVAKTNAKQKKSAKISSANIQTKEKLIGIVSHYFDKISVAAIKLSAPLKVGDKIVFRDHLNNDLFEQEVTSLQINREPINKAQKGDEVGLKVDGKIHDGNEVYLVE